MSPLLADALGSLFRWALALAVPFFVSRGIWTPTQAEAFVAGLSLAMLALAWSLWQKYGARADFVNALEAPTGTSESTVKAMDAPDALARKVGAVLAALALAGAMTACAGKTPAHTIADVGARLTPIAIEAQQTLIAAEATGLRQEYVAKAQVQFRSLGQTLQKLAAALDTYRVLSPRSKEQEDAGRTLVTIIGEARRIMRTVMVFTGGSEALATALNRSFDNMEKLFDLITTGLAPLPAPTQ